MSAAATIRQLKENDEDFEWYPSTEEIIRKVVSDICKEIDSDRYSRRDIKSVMDIGAGDGRVLVAIRDGVQKRYEHWRQDIECFAIEKAITHLSNMPKEITVIGTDFEQQALVDKPVGVIFSNPPYSQFKEWTLKIVREACASHVYLVIPRRWRDDAEIQRAIEKRSAEVTSLGEFDFENADRKARARVEVIKIEYSGETSAFDSVLEEMMPELDVFNVEFEEEKQSKFDRELVKAGRNLVEVLVESYDRDLAQMLENYRAAMKIHPRVLKELGVNRENVLGAIRLKVKGLKNDYWEMLFDEMDTVTERLATKQRKAFLNSLQDKVTIDFTANNVYSMLIWVSKWANDYFDEQLIDLFRTLSRDSNTVKYKSNDRVWTKGEWRYSRFREEDPDKPSHYRLEYRMVISHGGISVSPYDWEKHKHRGLAECAYELLQDIVTVSNNLGFPCKDSPRNYQWEPNQQVVLKLKSGQPLVAVRAFKNGNMHMHFNPKVMLAINVEAGRLLKWIRNPAEACEELQVTGEEVKQVAKMFGSSFRISPDSGFLRLENKAAEPEADEVEPEPEVKPECAVSRLEKWLKNNPPEPEPEDEDSEDVEIAGLDDLVADMLNDLSGDNDGG